MSILHSSFTEIWLVDFEFNATRENRQNPVCLVAYELRSKRWVKVWQNELIKMKCPPYSIGRNVLFVAYYVSAELGCHLSLGWSFPYHVLDLFTEFRSLTNGRRLKCGDGLIGALAYYGLGSIEAVEKGSMRNLILRGGPWDNEEKESILDYCESDVLSLKKLLPAMAPQLDLSRALLRGEYMKAAAKMEFRGVPIETSTLDQLTEHWEKIQLQLIRDIDSQYNIFEHRTFKEKRFAHFLNSRKIPWPKLDSGKLDLKDETFKEMATTYPELQPLRQLRNTLSQLRLSKLTVGSDGRNRCLLSAFSSRTARSQP
ncbi:MAG: DNA polymerase, partial [Planctomycetota bacterium]